jgi:hypothetical protein
MEDKRRTMPWASGRVLRQAQRERKRGKTRLSRKQAADRAKNRTAMLDETLRSMQTSLTEVGLSGQQTSLNQYIQSRVFVPSGCFATGKSLAS